MNKLFLLALGFMLITVTSCRSLQGGSSSMNDEPKPEPTTNTQTQEKPAAEKESKPIVVKEESFEVIESSSQVDYKYYVIIGSFSVLENARNYRTQLEKEGFSPVILQNTEGYYRISINAYNKENEARYKVSQIRGDYPKYHDTWLLIKKQ